MKTYDVTIWTNAGLIHDTIRVSADTPQEAALEARVIAGVSGDAPAKVTLASDFTG